MHMIKRRQGGVTVTMPETCRIENLPAKPRGTRDKVGTPNGESGLLARLIADGFKVIDTFQLAYTPRCDTARSPAADAAFHTTVDVELGLNEAAVLLTNEDGLLRWNLPAMHSDNAKSTGYARSRARFILAPAGAQPAQSGERTTNGHFPFFWGNIKTFVLKFTIKKTVDLAINRLENSIPTGPVIIKKKDCIRSESWLPSGNIELTLPRDRAARVLLLVHGTFSSTRGSYGGLTDTTEGRKFLKAAFTKYDAIIGYDHKTLSETPEANARALLQALQRTWGSALHAPIIDAIAFSRGGMVYRSLIELRLAKETEFAPIFRKVVFVGCTHAGTLLACPANWTALLDIYTNLVQAGATLAGLMPQARSVAFAASQIFTAVTALVKDIVAYAIKDEQVPGLAAMDPDGAFVRKLNAPGPLPPAAENLEHYAITADFEPTLTPGKLGTRLTRWLADGAVDRLMMNTANDLVVNTSSMLDIDPLRPRTFLNCHSFLRSDGVYHTVYFHQPTTALFLGACLDLPGFEPTGNNARKDSLRRQPVARLTKSRQLDAAPDPMDLRDWLYRPTLKPLQNAMINTHKVPAILDQGSVGACTGFALAAVADYLLAQREINRHVSPFMLYELARRYDEWPGEDYEGSSARGAMKGWLAHGVCERNLWPALGGRLTRAVADDARTTPGGAYYRVLHREIRDMHAALSETGILFATVMVHKGWSQPRQLTKTMIRTRYSTTPRPLMAITREGPTEGGHAIAIVGYTEDGFVIQNSWGRTWGTDGFALLPYDDYLMHATDVWVAQLGVPVHVGSTTDNELASVGLSRSADKIPLAQIRPYIIDIANNGRLSDQGDYWTTEADLRELFMDTIPERTAGWKKKRILLYLHGGLNSEKDVAKRVLAYRDVLLRNEIYPLHIMWETGAGETLTHMVQDWFTNNDTQAASVADWMRNFRNHLSEARNHAFELTTARLGRAMWREMKENARLASMASNGAMQIVAQYAARSLARVSRRSHWELHLIAHSAGSIFAAHLLPVICALRMPIKTLQFLAPAMTVALFRETLQPLIARKMCPNPTLYVLDPKVELADTVGMYGHSLLYLVSNAFEEARGTPLLGMAKFLLQDPELKEMFHADNLIVANQRAALSTSRTHGGFDNDLPTMNELLHRILGTPPTPPFSDRHVIF